MKSNAYISSLFLIACFGLLSTAAMAKEVTMYDQPSVGSKVVGKADLAIGIIPIYTPKSSDWVKIADPRNGNVGWVKYSDMNMPHTSFSFTQRYMSDDKSGGKGPITYQVIYGEPPKLSAEQLQTLQRMQSQQQMMQKSMQKLVQDMMKNANEMHQIVPGMGAPMLVPVIVVPAPINTQK
jgi:hypothetical protein